VSGFNVYRLYYDTREPVYFDTKSPYTKINVIWGGAGRAMTNIEFSRNINPRWNFGFNYRPILVDKQMLRQRRGDRQVMAHYYDFYSSFKSKNEKYLMLFNFRRTRHRVFETGGVKLKPNDTYEGYFSKEAGPLFVAAETSQLIRNIHFLNQYSLANAFQVYVKTDLAREANYFVNNYDREPARSDTVLFDNWETVRDSIRAKDLFRLSTFQNEIGFKGRAGFLFYNAYYKIRSYSAFYGNDTLRVENPIQFSSIGVEQYIGSRLAFDIDSLTRLSGQAEINQRGNYSIDAKFESKWVEASFVQSIARPGFLYSQYLGTHDYWNNSFKDIAALKLEGFLKTPFKKFFLSPGLTYTLLSNYVYFRKDDFKQAQTVLPVQAKSIINVANPQVRLGVSIGKHLRVSSSVINNLILTDDEGAMKIPDWLITSQVAWEDLWFKKNLQVQIGFEATQRSAYRAMGYDMAIQQYYVQNDVMVDRAFIADVFLNAKLKRGRWFVKYHNLTQLFKKTGYLITPNYPGQRNILDFGFELLLFD
jgi:Putative porin